MVFFLGNCLGNKSTLQVSFKSFLNDLGELFIFFYKYVFFKFMKSSSIYLQIKNVWIPRLGRLIFIQFRR